MFFDEALTPRENWGPVEEAPVRRHAASKSKPAYRYRDCLMTFMGIGPEFKLEVM
jgi:hypothetical protein